MVDLSVDPALLAFGAFIILVLGATAIAGLRDPNIRRALAIVRKNRFIDRFWETKRNLVQENGGWWYKIEGNRYAARGPYYQFSYRLVRSFGLRKYVGLQRIYIEGNPVPYEFEEDAKMAALRDTARLLGNAADSDLPTRLLRPRRVDMMILILVGVMAAAIGVSVGMAIKG